MVGTCLCGETEIKLKEPCNKIDICHCKMCRKWAAGPAFYLYDVFSSDEFEFAKKDFYKEYDPGGDNGIRGFCSNCGSSIAWKGRDGGGYVFNSELFEIKTAEIAEEVNLEEKPSYYNIAKGR